MLYEVITGYGLFTGAFGLHYGTERIGASVIPMSSGNTDKQIMIMQDYRSTALVCTPSYALTLADRMEKLGISPDSLALRVGLFGAEPWSEEMRREIEKRLGILATDNYGLSEMMGPGIAGECEHQCGMHIFEDHFIPEIINPDTGEVLPAGSVGELVLTSISKEAFPMIRYRTRDITCLTYRITSYNVCYTKLLRYREYGLAGGPFQHPGHLRRSVERSHGQAGSG